MRDKIIAAVDEIAVDIGYVVLLLFAALFVMAITWMLYEFWTWMAPQRPDHKEQDFK